MNRRQFAFWIGATLFGLSERLGAQSLDKLAAVAMQCAERKSNGQVIVQQHRWSYQEDEKWRWFERETLEGDAWQLTGRTTPIHRRTGETYTGQTGYLDESMVPNEVRYAKQAPAKHYDFAEDELDDEDDDYGEVNERRRARDGRPPSRWLRSLYAEELRLWLPEIDVPEVGVSGMTVWTHLTRDHGFEAARIEGLNDIEMAKLHSVAHYGY